MESLKTLKIRLDRGAMYFWSKDNPTSGYRLVNAFTLKTAAGVETRLDALRMTRTLKSAGFTVAKLEEAW